MTGRIDARLQELGIDLNTPAPPAANYLPFTISGNLVFIAGQIPITPHGMKYQGKLGADMSIERAQEAARLCAINVLAQLKVACGGDLDRVNRCIKLGGFVNATPTFDQHPAVINGASDLVVEVLGDIGRHARFAVGAASLPFDAAVEVDAIFEIA
jgi:enamine deaminase RidA (YjgF/YER057c/UK114 family)